ncbi:MAG TPA: hypothetical protein DCZ95_01150 [Verrucomicrobia bacterium]|nr:MAG: hypothetical protein A2X46_00970 [Lentisphaerae bacterium GWF2_57_35]HBA82675.1 hypothetical protein [Verrucomicrobiota bacterium]
MKTNRKIHEALNLLSEAAAEKKDDLQSLIADRYAHLKEVLGSTQADFSEAAHHGVERISQARHAAMAQMDKTATRLDRRVRNEPWQSLGWVAVAALAFGYLVGHKK